MSHLFRGKVESEAKVEKKMSASLLSLNLNLDLLIVSALRDQSTFKLQGFFHIRELL
jgi:hypothetical protein